MDWNEYEEVTKNIYETLGEQSGVKIVGWGNNFKVEGSSGVSHQIDVLTSHSDGIHTYLTDIECKYWNQKINKDIVMKVKSIVDDCKFQKGVVVSKLGFTEDSIKYAESVNIGLVVLREPTEEDWDGRIKTIIFKMHVLVPEILKFEQFVSTVFEDMNGAMINTEDYVYHFEDESPKKVKDILDDFQKKLNIETPEKEIEETIKFPKGTILKDVSGRKVAIVEGLKISGRLSSTEHETIINGENNVWLMMKSIFEGKTYAISKDGNIKDVTK